MSKFHRAAFSIILVMSLALPMKAQPTTAPAASVIEGIVTSPDLKPVAGAKVGIFEYALPTSRSEYPRLAAGTTDAQGKFRISFSTAPQVIVSVQAEGYGILLMTAPTDPYDEPLAIQLSEATTVKVPVVGIDGRPMAGVRVIPSSYLSGLYINAGAYWPKALANEWAQKTDASGIATFNGLPKYSRMLFVADDERYAEALSAPAARGAETTDPPVDHTPLVLEPAANTLIEGHVYFGDSKQPAPNVLVIGAGDRYGVFGKTDAQGKFRLQHMRPGEIHLIARPGYPLSTRYAGQNIAVQMQFGGTLDKTDLLLVPGAVIHGHVMNGTTPVPGVTVIAGNSGPDRVPFEGSPTDAPSQDITAADGSYTIHVLPGRYALTMKLPEGLNLVVPYTRQEVDAAEDKEATVDLALESGRVASVGTVKGMVVDEQGNPVEGALIGYYIALPIRNGITIISGGMPRSTNMQRASSDASGKFEMNITGPSAQIFAKKGELGLPAPITVDAQSTEPKLVLRKTAGSSVIHAVQTDGQPIVGATVAISTSYPWSNMAARWGTTGADGSFVFSPTYPDRSYRLIISAPGFASVGSPTGGLRNELTLTVEPGKQVDSQTFKMQRTDSFLTGVVVNENGVPQANATVVVNNNSAGRSRSTKTDGQGNFLVDGLVDGEQVSVTVTPNGGVRGQPVPMTAGTMGVRIVHVPYTATRSGRAPAPGGQRSP